MLTQLWSKLMSKMTGSFSFGPKLSSKLFHLPGMFAYDRTKADRCYASAEDAESDGLHRAKR